MAEIEMRIKEMIIQRYGSMKKFCEKIDMPWTTLDSILKRGIANSNISNVLKITKELRVNTELLVAGIIKPTTGDDLLDYCYDKTSEIIELIENDGYTVLETNSPYAETMNDYLEELLFQRCLEARIECRKSNNTRSRERFIVLFELIIDARYEEAYIEWICRIEEKEM